MTDNKKESSAQSQGSPEKFKALVLAIAFNGDTASLEDIPESERARHQSAMKKTEYRNLFNDLRRCARIRNDALPDLENSNFLVRKFRLSAFKRTNPFHAGVIATAPEKLARMAFAS